MDEDQKTTSLPEIVRTPYTNHNIECPFCNERVQIIVSVKIEDVDVQHVGTSSFNIEDFTARASTTIVGVGIHHSCDGPRKKD